MFCQKKITNIAEDPEYLTQKFYGSHRKSLTEDMVCFQQAAVAYLQYYKANNMHMAYKNKELNMQGDEKLTQYENRLEKYLQRMFEVVQLKHKKYTSMSEDAIFKELDKVIACQLSMEISSEIDLDAYVSYSGVSSGLTTKIPLVDIIVNIDLFTASFEDRNMVLRVIKELFNHCTTMKKLLLKHGKLILAILMRKYDKQCHLYQNKMNGSIKRRESMVEPAENRDEFLAVIIGQLIRLFAKSKSMSQVFNNFITLEKIVNLMQHEQYIIQSDAQKTFDTILKGPRIFENLDRPDAFVEWIEKNQDNSHEKLKELFKKMRSVEVYSFKRLSMKLQYEILSIGLKGSMMSLAENQSSIPEKAKGPYFIFSTYFVDDKENLKDIMQQLGSLSDDEERIKEELFLLLSFFILTFEHRKDHIKNIILKNKSNFVSIISDFRQKVEDEDTQQLLDALASKLTHIQE